MSRRQQTLVSAEWVRERLDTIATDDADVRLAEVNIDPERYAESHIPGAISFDWNDDLQDDRLFDIVKPTEFARVLGDHGIDENTTVVLYGDLYNWFAAYAYWLFTYYGHDDVRLLNGGWNVWSNEGNLTTDEKPTYTSVSYPVPESDSTIRADAHEVTPLLNEDSVSIIDVRSPPEYRGDVLSPPGWNESVQRGGHIPGAKNVPWHHVVDESGRFRSNAELQELFDDVLVEDVIVYCRIGERSALTWVALHELLEQPNVRHYYGSWVEWGNTVGAPLERGE
ncbi:sulfurtransferase [Halorubrum gandharaense]